MLHTELSKYPMYADVLHQKLKDIQDDSKLWNDRLEYENLIIFFEKILDECEAELASHGMMVYVIEFEI